MRLNTDNCRVFLYAISMFCFLLLLSLPLGAQVYTPLYHWTFDTKEPLTDNSSNRPWSSPEISNLQTAQGILGNYFQYTPESKGIFAMPANFKNDFSIEFWMKFDPDNFKKGQMLFFFNDRKAAIAVSFPKIQLTTLTKTADGKIVPHSLALTLEGTGKESLSYYLDNSWHHFVFQYNVTLGIKEIWVDGELLPGLRVTDAPKGILCGSAGCDNNNLRFTQFDSYNINFVGGLDEIAIYFKSLPPNLIKQHYEEVRRGRHYTFNALKAREVLSSQPKTQIQVSEIDRKEFAPNHPHVRLSAIEQLSIFPLPRYKKGHSLNRLFNWMALDYFGGSGQKNIPRQIVIRNSTLIQEELSINWNYYLTIQGTRGAIKDAEGKLSPYTTALIQLANKYPQIPLSVITLWAQVVPAEIGLKESSPRIYQAHPDFAIRNAQKKLLDVAGNEGTNTYFMSPRIPESIVKTDGQIQAKYLQNLLDELNRPIDIINENGEVPFLPYPQSTLEKDPDVVWHKNKLGIKDWDTYQALQKNRLRMAYSQEFLQLPALKNTRFSWYGVDGGPQDRFEWKTARLIHSKVNGQYYSTPDFYVQWPSNWDKVRGPWRGFPWIEDSRKVEIDAGDKLFSPFVAAGWSPNPEDNVRPSQWLGLLKCLGPIGAEFYYTGFFNVTNPAADPKNYAWQAVIPAYAQAITSQYENILRKGNVLTDRDGSPLIRLKTGDPRVLATVRKYGQQYILALALQSESNIKGNVPDEIPISLNFEGHHLRAIARRQGSVYVYDLQNPSKPVFYQLDSWHEKGHPTYWSKDFRFEAEVFDYSKGQDIITEQAQGSSPGNFESYHTFLKAVENKACSKYHFQPRNKSSYSLRIRARCRSGNKGKIGIIMDGIELGEISGIKSGNWQWYELSGKIKNLEAKDHMLSLLQMDLEVEIDKFVLEAR